MKVTSAEALAAAVRDQRKCRRLTQKETAAQVEIKQSTVSGFETHPQATKLDTLFKILAALELELQVVPRGSTVDVGGGWTKEW